MEKASAVGIQDDWERDILLSINATIKSCGQKIAFFLLHLCKADDGQTILLPTVGYYSGQCSDDYWSRTITFGWLRWWLSFDLNTKVNPAGWPPGPLPHERITSFTVFSCKRFTIIKDRSVLDILPRVLLEQHAGQLKLSGGWWHWWVNPT